MSCNVTVAVFVFTLPSVKVAAEMSSSKVEYVRFSFDVKLQKYFMMIKKKNGLVSDSRASKSVAVMFIALAFMSNSEQEPKEKAGNEAPNPSKSTIMLLVSMARKRQRERDFPYVVYRCGGCCCC